MIACECQKIYQKKLFTSVTPEEIFFRQKDDTSENILKKIGEKKTILKDNKAFEAKHKAISIHAATYWS